MDKALLNSCLPLAASIVIGKGVVNQHLDHVRKTVVELAFDLHDEIQDRIAQKEALTDNLPGVKERERNT